MLAFLRKVCVLNGTSCWPPLFHYGGQRFDVEVKALLHSKLDLAVELRPQPRGGGVTLGVREVPALVGL